MFRSRKTPKVEYVTPGFYKDWSNASAELESLGRRLDATRSAIFRLESWEVSADHWALRQWKENEAILLRKWKHTLRLKEVGLRQVQKQDSGPDIDYSWWEKSDEVGVRVPFIDNLVQMITDKLVGNTNLDRAWELARNESLQKARQGLG